MRRYSLNTRKLILAIVATLVASLGVASAGQAQVVDMNALGSPTVQYNPSNQSGYYGVALVPGTSLPATVPAVVWSSPCTDPALTPDLTWLQTGPISPLCWHNGPVMHSNETFALTWDPGRSYWATTRNYVEQFLSDVATGSGTFTSPYSITPQYTDGGGRAANSSIYGGGCIDYGSAGGYTCRFGAANPTGSGNDYPTTNNCAHTTGKNLWGPTPDGPLNTNAGNTVCLTDSQIQSEVTSLVNQAGIIGRTKGGATPLVVVLTPPGVETCLDQAGTICSANSDTNPADANAPKARFCSYHSHVMVGNTDVAYVVQPWTASWNDELGCDDPSVPTIPNPVPVQQLATDVGARLVSPVSQGQLAAIVNPALNGWFNNIDGTEINDNGCGPLGSGLDNVSVGGTTYPIQREFDNAGAIENDPNALPCIGWTALTPAFVLPSPVDAGDVVLFDGSVTASSLIVPKNSYTWNFGDGTTAVGPSVVHEYSAGGTYTVTLHVTDRGGNQATISQRLQVLGANGQPVTSPPPSTPAPGSTSGPRLNVHLQMLPQSLKSVLKKGIAVRVSSNKAANGIATVWITRAAAKRAHIKIGKKAAAVRIGLGTVSSITNGTVTLRLHLSRATAKKLAHLRRLTMTVRLQLVASGNQRVATVAAGQY